MGYIIRPRRLGMGFLSMARFFFLLVFAVMNAGAADFKTIKPGVLTVAFNGDMPGTSVKDGKLIGLDGEMMQWVADGLGLKVEPVLMEWSAEIAAVEAGRADIMHGMMGWSAARTKVLLMSDPIYYQPTGITQKKGQNWSKLKDLEGKRVGTITGFAWVDEMKKIPGAQISLYDTSDAAIRDLLAGRVDALIADGPLVEYAIVKNPGWTIHQLPLVDPGRRADFPILTGVNNALFAVNKQSGPLLDAINTKIQEGWKACKNLEIAKKYGMSNVNMWFKPPPESTRVGVDRPKDWVQPTLPPNCK
jgi:ABC-type amino acid transport substrate-binding protein